MRTFPEIDKGKWPVSTDGGDSPLWSPNGRELSNRSGDSFIDVDVETEPGFKPGKSAVLFKGTYVTNPNGNECVLWDIHPEGKRFLMVKPLGATAEGSAVAGSNKISIVLNWFEELKERVPVK